MTGIYSRGPGGVERPSKRAGSGQEALPVGRQGSGGPPGELAVVERPSWRAGSDRGLSWRAGGWEGLLEGQEGLV